MESANDKPMYGVLGIIREDGRLLIIQRSKHVRVPLVWCFPGGEIEDGETQEEALVREMREELGVDVEPGEFLMTQIKHEGRLVLHCWSARIVGGVPRPDPREVAALEWMTPAEIRRAPEMLNGTTDILDGIGL